MGEQEGYRKTSDAGGLHAGSQTFASQRSEIRMLLHFTPPCIIPLRCRCSKAFAAVIACKHGQSEFVKLMRALQPEYRQPK